MMKWLQEPVTETQIRRGSRLWLYVIAVLVMVFLVVPTLLVIPMSFSGAQYLEFPPRQWSLRWYESYFNSTAWMQATATSLKAGVLTALVATPLGTMAAYGLLASRVRYAGLLTMLLLTPMVVPIILIGIGVFYAYVKLQLVNTLTGLVLAHSMLAIPVVMMVVSATLKTFDMNQELVARSLGASRLTTFLQVTFPQIRFSVITGAVLAFLTSFDEIIVSLFVSGGDHSTLTRNMFNALRDQIDPTIAAISTLIVISTSLIVVVTQFTGKADTPR
ncbi:MAG: ABC transporter permease [Polaromonas sp.]|nr:ABC transporter permease [Polaromonas sp.]